MAPLRVDEESLGNCQSQTLDLPMLRNNPSYECLLKTLKDLELPPTSWSETSTQDVSTEAKSVSRYLLSIVSSALNWLEKNDHESEIVACQKDKLWELASRRLAERCGRSAMPEMIRTWVVPASTNLPELKFEIREPPLTGDNLGLKTWGTAFAIVQKLEVLGKEYFTHLLKNNTFVASVASERSSARVLELGSGTGLVGIAAGAIWGAEVILTDLPEIEENLLFNIDQNRKLVEAMGGSTVGEVLDWNDANGLEGHASTLFEIVIAADSLYDDEHAHLVTRNIKRYLKPHIGSRALVAIPMRDSHTSAMACGFTSLMRGYGLVMIHDGHVICRDDWAEDDGEEAVKCWWSIWKLHAL